MLLERRHVEIREPLTHAYERVRDHVREKPIRFERGVEQVN
jgi:hypothetical protein